MRIALTIDDEIAKALEVLARRSNRPLEDVVNDTLRAGLDAGAERQANPYVVQSVALGGSLPGIDLDKALALAEAIEDEELASKRR